MKKVKINLARLLLAKLGGLASLVAGAHGHYIADKQTERRPQTRGRVGGGTYGRNLKDHFDQVQFEKMKARKAKRNV